jgi:hypothetical protein
MMRSLLLLALFFGSSIALGQDQQSPFVDIFKSWPEIMKLLAFVAALQVFCRGLSEALTRISNYTDNTWDNKIAAYAAEAAWFLGAILGKVGYGEPKLVSQEKIDQAKK